MKSITSALENFSDEQIMQLEKEKKYTLFVNNTPIELEISDVEILTQDIPGWLVTTEKGVTIAIDVRITEALKNEGIAREMINRIQHLRKELGFDVTDKITIYCEKNVFIEEAVKHFKHYICSETLANDILIDEFYDEDKKNIIEINEHKIKVQLTKTKYHGQKSNKNN